MISFGLKYSQSLTNCYSGQRAFALSHRYTGAVNALDFDAIMILGNLIRLALANLRFSFIELR